MCRDAANDGRGYMIVLDDADLETLVKSTTAMHYDGSRTILNDRFDQLVL